MTPTQIKNRILKNKTISGIKHLLKQNAIHELLDEGSKNLPPFLMSSELDGADDKEPNKSLTRSFEYLSLAMRVVALPISLDSNGPVYLRPPNFLKEDLLYGQFQPLAIKSKDLLQGILKALESQNSTTKILSIKIVGAEIQDDLDLSKIRGNLSIRLIGCWIRGALILDRSTVKTIDLSGSIIDRGVSANFLHVNGSLRLRRTVSLGPVDFGSARIKGTFDATDCIVVPRNSPPTESTFIGGRGMLNLHLTTVEKDLRLIRARIYGGVNLRGTILNANFFLNDAIIRSPSAVIMRQAMTIISKKLREIPKALQPNIPEYILAACHAEFNISRLIWPNIHDQASFRHIELLGDKFLASIGDEPFDFNFSLLSRLLSESTFMPESALLGEGLSIAGTFRSNGARFSGNLRLKSCRFGRGISFAGARFFSGRAIANSIKFLTDDLLKKFEKEFSDAPYLARLNGIYFQEIKGQDKFGRSFRNEFALNLKDSNIGGALDLGKDSRRRQVRPDKFFAEEKGIEEKTNIEMSIKTPSSQGVFEWVDNISTVNWAKLTKDDQASPDSSPPSVKILKGISKKLCNRPEDPYKFIGLFFPRSGDPYSILENVYKKLLKIEKLEPFEAKIALWRQEVLKISNEIDSQFYLYEKGEIDPLDLNNCERPPAKIYKSYTTEQIEKVANLNAIFGAIRGVILIGNINLKSTIIEGDLIASGLISNPFDNAAEKPISPYPNSAYAFPNPSPVIRIQNAVINGDFDIRDSLGVNSIHAQQIHIKGSFKSADKPVFSAVKDKWSPIRRRALFFDPQPLGIHLIKNKSVSYDVPIGPKLPKFNCIGEYKFERSFVGGGMIFVFDSKIGPTIDLESCEIKGVLSIVPGLGGLELNDKELSEIKNVADQRRRSGRPTQWNKFWVFFFQILTSLTQPVSSLPFLGQINIRCKNRLQETKLKFSAALNVSKLYSENLPPQIDLRSARCSEISFPPSCWPQQDGLVLSGFSYESSRDVGPLTAPRRSWDKVFRDQNFNIGKYVPRFSFACILLIASVVCISVMYRYIGYLNSFLLVSLVGLSGYHKVLKENSRPKDDEGEPLAIHWLKLQRRRFNVRRTYKEAQPFQPYSKAASVLRTSGRQRSANEVELARLRERRHAMSNRTMWPIKIILKACDVATGYGFNVGKTLLFISGLILFGSTASHVAADNYMVVATNKHRLELSMEKDRSRDNTVDLRDRALKSYSIKNIPYGYPEFNSLLYSLDVIVPFLDIGQETHWAVISPYCRQDWCNETKRSKNGSWFRRKAIATGGILYSSWIPTIPSLIKVLGWLFGSLLLVTVAARVESIIARNEET